MKRTLALLVLLTLLFTLRLGTPGFWEKDEARYAQSAREMRRSGDLLVPTLGGQVRLNKPPLFYWLVAASQATLGETELASRLPSALAGIATSLLVFVLARRLAGYAAGALAALAYATAPLAVGLGRLSHPESYLTLSVTAALLLFYFAYRDGLRRRRPVLLMWVSMAVGFLAKGPHAVILPLLIISIFLAVRRDLSAFRRLTISRGLLIAVSPVAIWAVAVVLRDGWHQSEIWWRETAGRYFGAVDHPEPIWFFVTVVAGGFGFGTLWLPAAVKAQCRPEAPPGGGLFLLVWAVTALVFFSLCRSKTAAYALSVVPPLAVATGIALARLRPGGMLLAMGVLNAAVAATIALLLVLDLPLPPGPAENPVAARVTGGLLALAFAAVAVLSFFRRPRSAAWAGLLGVSAAILVGVVFLAPAVNRLRTMREAGILIRESLGPEDALVNMDSRRAGLIWYADHPVMEDLRFKALVPMWDEPRRLVVFADRKLILRLERAGKKPIVLHEFRERGDVILANR